MFGAALRMRESRFVRSHLWMFARIQAHGIDRDFNSGTPSKRRVLASAPFITCARRTTSQMLEYSTRCRRVLAHAPQPVLRQRYVDSSSTVANRAITFLCLSTNTIVGVA